mgnify:CR=1 FL=1
MIWTRQSFETRIRYISKTGSGSEQNNRFLCLLQSTESNIPEDPHHINTGVGFQYLCSHILRSIHSYFNALGERYEGKLETN